MASGGVIRATTAPPSIRSLDQITAENFSELEVAWRWKTVDTHLVRSTDAGTTLLPAETVFDLLEAEEPDRWGEWDGVTAVVHADPPSARWSPRR